MAPWNQRDSRSPEDVLDDTMKKATAKAGGVISFVGNNKKKLAALAVAGLTANSTMFVIQQTERGNVRRLGVAQYETPLQPGLHFKAPFIDTADKLQVSLRTLHIPKFDVTTVDNQKVTLDMNFNYTVPLDKIYHLMYEVGKAGHYDIDEQVIPVAMDRASRVLSRQNMVSVNLEREKIQKEIETNVSEAVKELFGIEPHSLQIAGIRPSDAFLASNEAAVRAKNEAVAAENTVLTVTNQARQKVVKATGDADAKIQEARGDAEFALLKAQAEKTKRTLEGQGEQAAVEAQMKPFAGSVSAYLDYMRAKANVVTAERWNGVKSLVESGNGGNTVTVVPLPPTAASGQAPALAVPTR